MKKNFTQIAIMALTIIVVSLSTVKAQMTAAPTPPARSTTNVISVFSNAYTNVSGIDWYPNWGSSTVITDTVINGDSLREYSKFDFQGVQFGSPLNVSSMTYVHIDVYFKKCDSVQFYFINTTPAVKEQAYNLKPSNNGWNSFDIPLSTFNTIALSNINQFKFQGSPFVYQSGVNTIYYDNIYFWKAANTPTLSNFSVPDKYVGDVPFTLTAPSSNSTGAFTYTSSNSSVATINGTTVTIVGAGSTVITANQAAAGSYGTGTISASLLVTFPPLNTAAPVPTKPASNVISLFSDSYFPLAGIDWYPGWGQSTVETDVQIQGNTTKKLDFFNYQGTQLTGNLDVSKATYLHIDVYTPNATALDVFLINTYSGTVEQAVTVTPTLNGWNQFDILLSKYTNINLAKVNQLKWVATPFGGSTIYLDNVYFWANTQLGVTITNFTANKLNNKVALNWKTITETNNKGFYIERRSGKDWTTLEFVAGKGNSNVTNNYSYIDEYPSTGVNYYRLKQVDIDGKETYYPTIVSVNNNVLVGTVSYYPNPTKGVLNVKLGTITNKQASISIINTLGKTVLTRLIANTLSNTTVAINLEAITRGIYTVKYQDGEVVTTSNIIVQ